MPAKLSEGDTVAMQGEVTIVHEDRYVTCPLERFRYPGHRLDRASEHHRPEKPKRGKPLRDVPD
jgi:hypothetical protein